MKKILPPYWFLMRPAYNSVTNFLLGHPVEVEKDSLL